MHPVLLKILRAAAVAAAMTAVKEAAKRWR